MQEVGSTNIYAIDKINGYLNGISSNLRTAWPEYRRSGRPAARI